MRGRLRGKQKITGNLFAGAELFGMGNEDFDGWGAAPVLGIQTRPVSFTLKAGYKHTTTHKGGFYTGIEFYAGF